MRMYLSSFRPGQHHEHLLRPAGDGRRTALVPNALDNMPAQDPELVVSHIALNTVYPERFSSLPQWKDEWK